MTPPPSLNVCCCRESRQLTNFLSISATSGYCSCMHVDCIGRFVKCDFLLVFNSHQIRTLHRFPDIKLPKPTTCDKMSASINAVTRHANSLFFHFSLFSIFYMLKLDNYSQKNCLFLFFFLKSKTFM